MAKQGTRRRVTAGEALYVLDRLVKSRRVSEREITSLVSEMHREIKELERRLADLREAVGEPKSRSTSQVSGSPVASPRRRRTVTPDLEKSRRLQGEYMGLIRHLRAPARARMKKLASEQGREAAIKAMRASTAA